MLECRLAPRALVHRVHLTTCKEVFVGYWSYDIEKNLDSPRASTYWGTSQNSNTVELVHEKPSIVISKSFIGASKGKARARRFRIVNSVVAGERTDVQIQGEPVIRTYIGCSCGFRSFNVWNQYLILLSCCKLMNPRDVPPADDSSSSQPGKANGTLDLPTGYLRLFLQSSIMECTNIRVDF